ncbi:MAG TPA: SDR family NAD(P)-dependent oxidoreductase, partial [Acidobacteriaceae bacterium]|nr:SDR family NAD(P)-dependent oxidoreductase [Acidobacteriaceae bacterium]
LRETLAERGIAAQALTVSHAFHSPLMEPMLDEFEQIAQGIQHHAPQVDLVSNVTGTCLGPSDRITADYWRRHVRGTVRFADGVASLMNRKPAALLEIGPDPVLLGMAKPALPSAVPTLSSMRRGKDLWSGLYESLRQLYLLGAPVAWDEVYRDTTAQKLELPTYPFERQRYWISPASKKTKSAPSEAQSFDPLLFTTRWQPLATGGASARPDELVDVAELEFLTDNTVSDQYATFLPQLNHLCALYILDTLRHVGVRVASGELLPIAALAERFPSHRRLLARMGSILREDGIVEQAANGLLFRSIPEEIATAEHARLVAQWPAFSAELGFLAQTSRMHEVLTGTASALEVLFPAGSLQLAERVYQDAPAAQAFHRATAVAVREAVQSYAAGQKVRVLEVGAGTGSTTSYVLPLLANLAVDYRFTDISPAFLEKARAKFSAFPFVRYATLDLENQSQLTAAEPADVVIAANVVHATADLRQTLARLRQTLAPGGVMILVEGTAPQRFGDLTVGMTEGWWRFTDTGLRPDYPLISREQWLGLLREAGFEADALGVSSTLGSLATQQTILIAQLPQARSFAPLRSTPLRLQAGQAHNKARIQEHLAGASTNPRIVVESAHPAADVPQATFNFACEALGTLQQVAEQASGAAEIWFVVHDSPDGLGALLFSATEALAKTAQIEHPQLRVRCVRLPQDPTPHDLSQFEELLLQETSELSFRVQNGTISVQRLVRPEEAGATSWSAPRLRADAAYLITGGYGGLGFRTAEWMVDRGAKHIFLTGRRPPSAETQQALDLLHARGAKVVALTGDISEHDHVQAIFAQIQASGSPLRGVIHAAGTVEDSTLLQQSPAHLAKVFAAKVNGSWLLHEATRSMALDFFVLYGSAASTLGSAGQANHSASNGFLDGLAEFRQKIGLPGTTIAWGAWSEIGAATQITDTARGSRLGLGTFPPEKGIEMLEQAIGSGLSRLSALPVDWPRYLVQPQGSWPLFDVQRVASGAPADVPKSSAPDLKIILADTPSDRRVEAISAAIRSRAALVLRLESAAAVRDEQPFPELGLDSLMAVELKNDLQASSGVSLPANFFFEFPTVRQAAAYLNAKMAAQEDSGRRMPDSAEYEEVEL